MSPGAGDGDAVEVFDAGTHVVLHRHGVDPYTPAHLVDHVANVLALQSIGCDRVLAISSVGGLHPSHGVGTFVVPDDFIALDTSISVYDDVRGHVVPWFDRAGVPPSSTRQRTVVRRGAVA